MTFLIFGIQRVRVRGRILFDPTVDDEVRIVAALKEAEEKRTKEFDSSGRRVRSEEVGEETAP